MKKSLLLLGLGLAALTSAQAQDFTSPWQGSALPEEGGTYYLYNVESGLWLQANHKIADDWTTRAQLDTYGFDVIISPITLSEDDEYYGQTVWQLDPRFGHNHSINAVQDQGYLDTGNPLSKWTITPDQGESGYDIPNLYTISALDGVIWLGADLGDTAADTYLSYENQEFCYWQFVSKEERMADLMEATKDSPKDATWLIDDYDFNNANDRTSSWKVEFQNAGANAFGGDAVVRGNRAFESWSNSIGSFSQTLTGLPNGVYGLKLQGFYRDGSTGGVGAKRNQNTEEIRAYYFANEVKAPLLSICQNSAIFTTDDMFPVESDGYFLPGDGGSALPNASHAFFEGEYWNEEILVTVTNGTLRIGVGKDSAVQDDWTVFDSFRLTYYGDQIDVTALVENLNTLISEVNAYEGPKPQFLIDALNTAIAAAGTTDAEAIGDAINDLTVKFAAAKASAASINNFNATLAICQEENKGNKYFDFTAAIAEAQAIFDAADSAEAYADALNRLQIARKLNNAERSECLWEGSEPADGEKFYFYNIGQGRFFCGGDDWGTHASLGWPGIEIGLIAVDEAFSLDTYLPNGDGYEFLNYGGYVDCAAGDNWTFVPVGNGIYNIQRATADEPCYLGYRTGTAVRVDTDMHDATDPNCQWMLVSRAERDKVAATATAANPIDMSYRIGMPGFNQRDDWDNSGWYANAGSIWNRGSNMPDFAYECWNEVYFDMNQIITDLPAGYYTASVQGYYRDGDHADHINKVVNGEELNREAYFYAGDDGDEIQLPSITDEAGKAPGQGAVTAAGEFPEWIHQAVNYFQNNLYKVSLDIQVYETGELQIGVNKDLDNFHDWVVVDNFRIIYRGAEDPESVRDIIDVQPVSTGKLYDLRGMEVSHPTAGIYVRDGRKVVIR